MDLDLCFGCQRHVRSTETTCPFCGAARAPGAPEPPARHIAGAAPRSRAQRYVLGAAVVAGIGIAKASAAQSPDAGNAVMAVAAEPVVDNAEEDAGARPLRERYEDERREQRHQGGGPCMGGGCCGGPVICPPYGCVFPDEAIDNEHAIEHAIEHA